MLLAGIASLFREYPEWIAHQVSGPYGICREQKWMPSISEIKDACEKAMQPVYADRRIAENKARQAKQLADRTAETNRTDPERIRAIADKFLRGLSVEKQRGIKHLTMEELQTRPVTAVVVSDDLAKIIRGWKRDGALSEKTGTEGKT